MEKKKGFCFFANNYVHNFHKVYLFAPDGASGKLLHPNVHHIAHPIRGYKNLVALVKIIRRHKIDFVQGHKRATLPYLLAIEKLTAASVNFNFDSYYTDRPWLYKFAPKQIHYLSDEMKTYYSRWTKGKNNITLNMGGEFLEPVTETERNQLAKELDLHGKFVLLSLGRLSPEKNQALLIKALQLLKNDSIVCLFAGNGPDENQLKDLAEKRGVAAQIRFLGYRKDIAALLSVSHALVQTSNQEGFPNVFIEAASLAKPIITTKVGSYGTLVRENGLAIDVDDENQLAQAIQQLIAAYDVFASKAEAMQASDYFQQFHKRRMLESYLTMYRIRV